MEDEVSVADDAPNTDDFLSMSDDDILNMEAPVVQEAPEPSAQVAPEEAEVIPAEEEEESDDDESEDDEVHQEEEPAESEEDSEDEDDSEDDSVEEEDSSTAIDAQAELDKLLAPFQANGREMQAKSVDDAITLMKMGANYNKKMAGLKPSLKIVKMLEKADLLDENKLNYLIDLHGKNPQAIQKLLKDSEFDPLSVEESTDEYVPANHSVSDTEVALDEVLDSIQSSPSYAKTIDVIGNQWDDASKEILTKQPEAIRLINSHMENGIYDQIQAKIDSERMFGRLAGLTDLEAYRAAGDMLYNEGAFNKPNGSQPAPAKAPIKAPAKPKADDSKRAARKRSASPTKAAPAPTEPDFNPLAMSDEEIEKMVQNQYI